MLERGFEREEFRRGCPAFWSVLARVRSGDVGDGASGWVSGDWCGGASGREFLRMPKEGGFRWGGLVRLVGKEGIPFGRVEESVVVSEGRSAAMAVNWL